MKGLYSHSYSSYCASIDTATGDGERIMQFCPSYQIVQHLRAGATPQAACERVITDMLLQTNKWFEVGLIALDTKVNCVHVVHLKTCFCSSASFSC